MVVRMTGVAPSGPGHSGQAPEPQKGLGHSASVPNAMFSPAPWVQTYFTRPDGSEIETVEHVAETVAYSARQSEVAKLHGVTLTGADDGMVICYTGNGPTSEANARLIAAAPDLYEALAIIAAPHSCSNNDEAIVYVQRVARAALAKARGDQ